MHKQSLFVVLLNVWSLQVYYFRQKQQTELIVRNPQYGAVPPDTQKLSVPDPVSTHQGTTDTGYSIVPVPTTCKTNSAFRQEFHFLFFVDECQVCGPAKSYHYVEDLNEHIKLRHPELVEQ